MSKNRDNYYLILLGLCYTLITHLLTKFKEVKMIISSGRDYYEAARRRVPPFMIHYADGGSYAEQTLSRNVSELENIALRQCALKDMSDLDTSIELFGEKLSIPTILTPVGACGTYARRGK